MWFGFVALGALGGGGVFSSSFTYFALNSYFLGVL